MQTLDKSKPKDSIFKYLLGALVIEAIWVSLFGFILWRWIS